MQEHPLEGFAGAIEVQRSEVDKHGTRAYLAQGVEDGKVVIVHSDKGDIQLYHKGGQLWLHLPGIEEPQVLTMKPIAVLEKLYFERTIDRFAAMVK